MLYAVPLSWDHKANLPKERSRIEATGGFVKYARGDYRVQGEEVDLGGRFFLCDMCCFVLSMRVFL